MSEWPLLLEEASDAASLRATSDWAWCPLLECFCLAASWAGVATFSGCTTRRLGAGPASGRGPTSLPQLARLLMQALRLTTCDCIFSDCQLGCSGKLHVMDAHKEWNEGLHGLLAEPRNIFRVLCSVHLSVATHGQALSSHVFLLMMNTTPSFQSTATLSATGPARG